MMLFGKNHIYIGKFENDKFSKYLFDEGVTDISDRRNSIISIECDDWGKAEPLIEELKEGIDAGSIKIEY